MFPGWSLLSSVRTLEGRCSKCTWVLSPAGSCRQRLSVVVTASADCWVYSCLQLALSTPTWGAKQPLHSAYHHKWQDVIGKVINNSPALVKLLCIKTQSYYSAGDGICSPCRGVLKLCMRWSLPGSRRAWAGEINKPIKNPPWAAASVQFVILTLIGVIS